MNSSLPPRAAAAWLVVGLGNPGREYQRNRHNVGFRAVDELARRHAVSFSHSRAKGKLAVARRGGEPLYLLKPQTWVNLSGQSVGPLSHFYHLPPERVLVICDDIDLPFGRLRIRPSGTSGGHNGLKSIIESLGGSRDFPRIRLGVGRPPHVREVVVNHVLENFSKDEEEHLRDLIPTVADAAELILDGQIDRAMDTYNGRKP
ncbi:MAG: aminoacyl-tRNA hydrolase [Chloroflexota bacterium]